MASDSSSQSSDDADGDNSNDSSSQNDSGGGSSGDSNSDSGGQPDKNWLEWLVFGIGVVLTLGVIGYLTYQVIAGSDEPADVRIVLDIETPSSDGSTAFVPVEATNEGDRVAEGVVVEVCAGPESCGEVTFPYIPKGSKRSGAVGLSLPLAGPIESRVVSYRKP